jgi:hypothetical protein
MQQENSKSQPYHLSLEQKTNLAKLLLANKELLEAACEAEARLLCDESIDALLRNDVEAAKLAAGQMSFCRDFISKMAAKAK